VVVAAVAPAAAVDTVVVAAVEAAAVTDSPNRVRLRTGRRV
jgi:hypothetical protein